MNHLQRLKEAIVLTASYYRQTIDPAVLNMYAEDLEDLDTNLVIEAYKTYRRDPKNRTFPLPAQIRGIIAPEPTPEAVGREVVDRIKIAIRDFGYMRANEAKAFIGEVGWGVVQGNGGWAAVCESDFIFNEVAIAQARNRAADLSQYGALRLTSRLNEQDQIQHEEKNLIDMEKRRQLKALVEHANKNLSNLPKTDT